VKENIRQRCARLWRAEICSPKNFVRRAVVIALLFLAAHIAGLRDYTSFLSGTVPSPDTGWKLTIFFGLIYLVVYFALVLLAPMLLLAAGLLSCWRIYIQLRANKNPAVDNQPARATLKVGAK